MASPTDPSVVAADFNSSKLVFGQSGGDAGSSGKCRLSQAMLDKPPQRDSYFASKVPRQDVIDACKQAALNPEIDGELRSVYILIEIDHWNNDYEKIVMLNEKSMVWARYDMVTRKYKHSRRLPYELITKLAMGDVEFPPKCMAAPRGHGAVRLYWGDPDSVSLWQKWNIFSSDSIPYLTLTHHQLHYCEQDRSDATYDVDAFYADVCKIISANYPSVPIVTEPIVINLLLGVPSKIWNQSNLGFSKDRNGVSF